MGVRGEFLYAWIMSRLAACELGGHDATLVLMSVADMRWQEWGGFGGGVRGEG